MSEPDPDKFGGLWYDQQKWKTAFDRKLAHKSVGIPMDDEVNVDNSKNGIGLKEILAIGMLGTGGVGLMQMPAIIDALRPNPSEVPTVSPSIDSTLRLGLGRIEDYLDLPE